MQTTLIDSHCHLHDERFDNERSEVIKRAQEAGVQTLITIGCDLETSQSAMAVAKEHDAIYFTVGVHPHEAEKYESENFDVFRVMANDPKCVAIGECGLDYYYDNSPREAQKAVFKRQILLANELKKALVVHVRDAFEDAIELLGQNREKGLPTIIHCFTGKLSQAQDFVALGFYISLSGVVTFKNCGELKEVASFVPMDKILVETDSPYLAPVPHRGKRNEPAFVVEVAKTVALVRNISLAALGLAATKNTRKAFSLPS